jgi:hypothetical protein
VRERLREIGRQRESLSSWDIGYDAHGAFLFSGGREGRPFPLFRIHRDGTVERGERLGRGSIDRDRRPVGSVIVGIRAWFIRSYSLAQAIENTYGELQEVRETLGISGPAMLSAAVCKARDYELDPLVVYRGRSLERANPPAVDETVVVRPTIETSDDVLRRSLKEVADYFWNVWGYPECNGFDREGLPADVLISWKGR